LRFAPQRISTAIAHAKAPEFKKLSFKGEKERLKKAPF
jgi:hypothetical protein